MSTTEMEAKALELKELQRLAEELQAEITATQDAIKAAMGNREEVTAGAFKITWKPVTTTRVDTTALRKALPDVAERFSKSTTTRRFLIA
jgi:predicted phage-related endonuclease